MCRLSHFPDRLLLWLITLGEMYHLPYFEFVWFLLAGSGFVLSLCQQVLSYLLIIQKLQPNAYTSARCHQHTESHLAV